MSSLGGERWKVLSPHLDRALEMAPHERGPWLESLAAADPTLAADLRGLLDEYQLLDEGSFLELAGGFAPTMKAGQVLGAYTLESLIGEGGMGSVWLARRNDGRFEGHVAIKFLRAAFVGTSAAGRFRREGNILARLTHPAIAHLLDAGVTEVGQPYLVLEYVEGEHIDRYCDRLALTVDARIRLFVDVLAVISHAHGHLVVHRDIKPSNVLVRSDGQVKLVDFGIAKLLEGDDEGQDAGGTKLTRDGERAMTPQYAAPEQVSGQPVTTATDVYSLGVLLYALLSGHHPFEAPTLSPLELMKAVVDTDPPRPSEAVTSGNDPEANAARRGSTTGKLRRDLRGDLDIIVRRAMKKKPAERYRSVDAFADDLRRYVTQQPILARPDSLAYRAVKLVQRHRALAAVIALAIVATLTGLGVALWQANEARQQRDRALHLLARSDALTEFFQFLLNDAGPPDQPLTIGAMLARSESLINNEFAAHPEHQAAILSVEAGYYATLGDAADAEARRRRAQSLAAGSSDRDLRAGIDCQHGYVLSLLGKVDEGVREIERVLAGPPPSPLLAANCYQSRAYIAQNQSDGAAADTFARAAQEALVRADRKYPSMEASVLADRGYAQQLLGRINEANHFYSQAVAQMTALGRERTPGALTIRNNWGIAILSSGDIKRAVAVYEDAIRAAEARDKGSRPPAFLIGNLAKALELAGRYPEALKYYEDAASIGRAAGRKDSLAFALINQAVVHVELGNAPRAEALIEESRVALGGTIPNGPPALAVLAIRGRIALMRGQLEDARRMLNDVIATHLRQGRANASVVMTRLYLADIALRVKRPDEAATLAQTALDEAQALQGGIRYSNRTGLSYLSLAEARFAEGKADEARQALSSALEHLNEALGLEHPATRRAIALGAALNPPAAPRSAPS
jgi:eukaryotic-like serine/threonine-protein kinase